MAAWGQHGFVYRLIHDCRSEQYSQPDEIHAPVEYLPDHSFGYGPEVLHRRYLEARPKREALERRLIEGMKKFSGFDIGMGPLESLVVFVASVAALLIYSRSSADIINYLEHNGFGADATPGAPRTSPRFSIKERRVVSYLFSRFRPRVIVSILTGAFAGKKAVIAWAGLERDYDLRSLPR